MNAIKDSIKSGRTVVGTTGRLAVERRELIAQEVARRYLEPSLEAVFHTDSVRQMPN